MAWDGQVTRGPLPEAPRVSLLTSARPLVLVDEQGEPLGPLPDGSPPWIRGYGYRTRSCGTHGAGVVCGDDAQTEKVLTQGLDGLINVQPWYAWAGDICSALPSGEDHYARAAALLDATSVLALEREFWRGDLAQAQGWGNPYLAALPAGHDLNGGTAVPAGAALGALQQALANSGTGARGMIHATRRTVDAWFSAHSGLRRDTSPLGPVLYDEFDNLIVAGAGYDGSGPDGSLDVDGQTEWAYATDVADAGMGTAQPVGQFPLSALDRGKNLIEARDERFVAASWERCRHWGINVDLGTAISGIPVRDS